MTQFCTQEQPAQTVLTVLRAATDQLHRAFDWDQLVPLSDAHVGTRLNSVGELVGCLYVIKGSALGGRTILRQLSGSLSIERSCRFFRGEGVKTRDMWNGFQRFCDDVCRGDQRIQEAIIAAKRTFTSIEDCLTLSMNGRCWSRHNRSTNSDRSN